MTPTDVGIEHTGTQTYPNSFWSHAERTSSPRPSHQTVRRIVLKSIDWTESFQEGEASCVQPRSYTGNLETILPVMGWRPHFHVIIESTRYVRAIAEALPMDEAAEAYSRALINRAAAGYSSSPF